MNRALLRKRGGQGFYQNLIRESFDKLFLVVSGFTVARQPMICTWFPFNAGFFPATFDSVC